MTVNLLNAARLVLATGLVLGTAVAAAAEDAAAQSAAVHAQLTYTEQEVGGFTAPYAGPNSLHPDQGKETVDATVYLGRRLAAGLEGWVNVEVDQGFGLDNTLGVAGFTSGEAYKVGSKAPYLRLPRAFLRATANRADPDEAVEAAANQLGGRRATDRWVVTLGKFGVTDLFDAGRYAHDPRTDFLNWAAIDAGTFDYAADAWGFTVGLAVERYVGDWTARLALFDLSTVPNSEHLTPGLRQYQGVGELEHRHRLADREGKVLVTAYDSHGRMGRLSDALAAATGGVPDVAAARQVRDRRGVSALVEQAVTDGLGLFARVGKADGDVEAYEFTDIDEALSAGLSLQGGAWRRGDDTVGVVALRNRISAARSAYLAAGGLGILIGDGRLTRPGPESIVEAYYRVGLGPNVALTADLQQVTNPGYNRDRGPALVGALRLHAQF